MLLAIDIGNTNTVFGLFDGAEMVKSWRAPTPAPAQDLPDVDAVIIASVVPGAHAGLGLNVDPVFVTHDMVAIADRVEMPKEVGADRLVNAAAVTALYAAPAIVLDFGTATTFDVVDTDGAYAGGVIAPGIHLSLKALHDATAQLPDIEIAKPGQVIGGNTLQAMQSGVYYGYLGLIKEIVQGIQGELAQPVEIIATGGLARLFADDLDCIGHVDEYLTLKGLQILYEQV